MNSNSDSSAETASVASQAPSSWGEGYIYADAAVTALLLALAVERAFERDIRPPSAGRRLRLRRLWMKTGLELI